MPRYYLKYLGGGPKVCMSKTTFLVSTRKYQQLPLAFVDYKIDASFSLLHTNRQVCRHWLCPVWVIPLELGALSAEHWLVRPDQEADRPIVPVLHAVCGRVSILK